MGTIDISSAQLAELERLQKQDTPPSQLWHTLADWGDSYAQSAVQVIDQPGSVPWTTVTAAWAVTGADFGKFDAVAKQHAANYIALIGRNPDPDHPGMYKLPTTRYIESSYVQALDRNGISPYTAIDVVIEKMIHDHANLNLRQLYNTPSAVIRPPHWYNTPGVMTLERERIEPSDPSNFRGMDHTHAVEVWLETGAEMALNMARTKHTAMESALFLQTMSQRLGKESFATTTVGGVSCYYNADTQNWAFFNPNHQGVASIDGKLTPLSQDNWRQRLDGRFEIRMEDGRWKTASVDQGVPDQAQAVGLERTGYGEDHAGQAQQIGQSRQGPFGDVWADQYFSALLRGDSAAMDQLATEFSQTPRGQQLAQWGDQALAEQQLQQQQQDALSQRGPVMRIAPPGA